MGIMDRIGTPASLVGLKHRMRQVAPGLYAPEVVTTGNADLLNQAGRVYFCGEAITLAGALAANNKPSFSLTNPEGSGRMILVSLVRLYSTVDQQVYFFENAVLPGADSHTAHALNRASDDPPVAIFAHSTQEPDLATGGGNPLSMEAHVSPSAPLSLNFPVPLMLPPGSSLVADGGENTAQTMTVNVYWAEVDL